jgi:glycosyltransferase involved in cell wall biosynthesis
VREKVKVLDALPTGEIADVMGESDLAIVPKRASIRFGNEAGSSKIWEFMALAVPVVASKTEIEAKFFDDSVIQYFRSEDEDDLVRAVLSVYRNPEFKRQLITNGTRYLQQSTWDETTAPYLRVVDALAQPGGPSGLGGGPVL